MTKTVNSIHIGGPIEEVFDVVTTTRHWPDWHPATESVGGVTDRPLALGDQVFERARIGGRLHEGTWTVAEHLRPARVVLQIDGGRIQIAYHFTQLENTTLLRRELRYRAQDFAGGATDPDALAERMGAQSQTALERLKPLVEGLLAGRPRA